MTPRIQMRCFTVWVADSKVDPRRSCRWASSLPDVPRRDERKMEIARLHLPASFLPSKILGQFRPSCFCLFSALSIRNHFVYYTSPTPAQSPQKYPNTRWTALCNQHIWFIIHFHVCVSKTDDSQRHLRDNAMMRCGGNQTNRYGGKHTVCIHT